MVQEVRRRPSETFLGDIVGDDPTAEDEVDQEDEVAKLLTLVNRLPEEERRAIQFFFLNGRDGTETARLLGRSRSGTYALIHRAIGNLARRMSTESAAQENPQ